MSDILTIRPATFADMRRLFEWRNMPFLYLRSTTGRGVTWEEHQAWFPRVLADPERLLMVIEIDGQGVGSSRLDKAPDREGNWADISIYIIEAYCGKGFGPRAISLTCAAGFDRWPIQAVHAVIRDEEQSYPSLAAFRKAGFLPIPASAHCPAGHIELRRLRS